MTALDLLANLEQRGLAIRLDGERLLVSPAAQLTARDREDLALHKPALLLILGGKGPRDVKPEGSAWPLLFFQPDPEREKVTVEVNGKKKRVPVRPRYYTWENAGRWLPVSPPEEAC